MAAEHSASKRVIYFDILRVVAIFFVVAVHLSAQHWLDVDVSSRAWFAFNLYCTTGKWSVPVFVMISGALFLRRELDIRTILKKYLLRIAIAFAFWSAAYALFVRALYGITWDEVLFRFFTGHYHMWFLFMIVGLYLIVPFLRPIVRDEKLLRYFLLLTLIFTFLLPQIASAVSLLSWQYCAEFKALTGKFYYHFTLGFVPYFVLGYYLVRKEFSLTAKRVLYALGVLGFVLTVVLTSFASRLQGAATELFYGYDSLNVLFVCVGLFVFAKEHLNFPNLSEKCHRCIRALSRWSFGAYLVHPLFIESFDIFLHFNTLSLNVFFSVPLLTLIIGALSFLVSALLHQIPFVKKYFV